MKQGQVTIFVIIALLVVVGVLAFFFFQPRVSAPKIAEQNPRGFLGSCVEEAVRDSEKKLLNGGGRISPSKVINYSFNSQVGQEPYAYLCHTANFFETCYNIQPMTEQTAEVELTQDTQAAVKSCFNRLKERMEREGFDVSGSFNNYSADILPGQIDAKIAAQITLTKGESSQEFSNFDFSSLSPLYSLLDLAEKVVAAESTYCYFDYNAYMILFPEFNIRRIDYTSSKIYRLTDRPSGATLKFAVRSCAFPI